MEKIYITAWIVYCSFVLKIYIIIHSHLFLFCQLTTKKYTNMLIISTKINCGDNLIKENLLYNLLTTPLIIPFRHQRLMINDYLIAKRQNRSISHVTVWNVQTRRFSVGESCSWLYWKGSTHLDTFYSQAFYYFYILTLITSPLLFSSQNTL